MHAAQAVALGFGRAITPYRLGVMPCMIRKIAFSRATHYERSRPSDKPSTNIGGFCHVTARVGRAPRQRPHGVKAEIPMALLQHGGVRSAVQQLGVMPRMVSPWHYGKGRASLQCEMPHYPVEQDI